MTPFPLQAVLGNPDVAMALAVLAGFGFGFVLERAGFGDARKLLGQFFGTEMLMLKVMFSAVATTVLLTALLDGVGAIDLRLLGDLVTTETWLWPMIAGGLLIGAGIVFSGYCPGTSLVGVASGKLDAVVAYGGVLVGRLLWAELETVGPIATFQQSGGFGHLYLDQVFGVPPAVLALVIAGVAVGSFLLGERIERALAKEAAPASPLRTKRVVFGAFVGAGVIAVATLALPSGAGAAQRPAGRIGVEAMASRVFEAPWTVRVIDLRGPEACASGTLPGAECVAEGDLAGLGLDADLAGRDLVVAGAGDLATPPAALQAYPGRVLLLDGGWEAWKGWALTPASAPSGGATWEEREAARRRAGVHAAMTGVKPAALAPAAAPAGSPPARKKKGGAGGGGCGG